MREKRQLLLLIFIIGAACMFSSCSKEESRETFPLSAIIHHSLVDKQLALSAVTHSAVSYHWDFGDGNTSTEKSPVHVYEDGGYYKVVLTATCAKGETVTVERTIAVALTPYVLLTGGPTAENGKTWKLAAAHSPSDKFTNSDAAFTPVVATLAAGTFNNLGMPQAYNTTYTFYFDGRYKPDSQNHGYALGGIVHQVVTTGGAGIINDKGKSYGLCIAAYQAQDNLTFSYTDNDDLTLPSVYGPGGVLTYNNRTTLNFTGNGFVGFLDKQQKVIVTDIKENSMQLIMFMAASGTHYPLNSNALFLTFEVVK
jgi:hypothetical protein